MSHVIEPTTLRSLPADESCTDLRGRRILVIGLSPAANHGVVQQLRERGIAACGFTRPEQAGRRFDAIDFEMIVFGRGTLGAVSEQLKRDFSEQNPHVRFVDAIQPVAVEQILAALAHDPHRPRFVSGFSTVAESGFEFASARILAPCRIALTIYRIARGDHLVAEVLPALDARPGPLHWRIDRYLADANSILLVANGEEYHLHPFLANEMGASKIGPLQRGGSARRSARNTSLARGSVE